MTDHRIQIEDRDLEILGAVAEHRFLTHELLLLLFPPDAGRTPTKAITAALVKRAAAAGRSPEFTGAYIGSNLERRLRGLFRAGFLHRIPRGLQPASSAAKPFAYGLAAAGRKLLVKSERLRRPIDALGPVEQLFFIEHTLMVSRFRIGLELAVRERPTLELVDSQRESVKLRFPWHERGERHRVCPDGFFVIRDRAAPEGRNSRACFLECDRNTMSRERLLVKFEDYARFEDSGRLAAALELSSARIVTVAETDARSAALLTLAAKAESPILAPYRDRFLFTSQEAYRQEPRNVLAQIWRAADKPGERAAIIPSPLAIS